ncbi:MAG: D-hexose-6-phosphate mutarotase [Pseudomonadota bacterium]
MDISALNQRFGIAGTAAVTLGKGGFPLVEVTVPGARAVISAYAGQVLSYQPDGQEDLFFLSSKAFWADGKAIKGGVPVCWPWFGPDPEGKGRPGHGFVRNRAWDLRAVEALDDGRVQVRVGLTESDATRAIWPYAFDLEVAVTVGAGGIDTALTTRNTGAEPFPLTQGLHTYFRVGDIAAVKVHGLEGTTYIDKMDNGAAKTQDGPVTIAREVDRIYTGVARDLAIEDAGLRRTIRIRASGSASAVVWNPWDVTAAGMADLEPNDYLRMICVETTNAGSDVVTVEPGGSHTLAATYSLA